ncbi:hypothetical protein M9H77_36449 [Catharanthus roseus]|uniref:Uncharacterized protein n=1 Tax=Catharanthus roseus TaxID=4058 RepID=A0ACB9ZTN0_CATRO|nr:hypothetical protein M9H77_36449 [Catharanthus roseus]
MVKTKNANIGRGVNIKGGSSRGRRKGKRCLPYGCFITKIFQYFVINLVRVGDHVGPGKIYNQHTFKRMGFERNDEGLLIRGGQQGSYDDDEEDNGDEEEGTSPKIWMKKKQMKRIFEEK